MKKNIGKFDKNARILLGLISGILGYFVSPWFFVLALVFLITALINFCGLYTLFGINTCEVEVKK